MHGIQIFVDEIEALASTAFVAHFLTSGEARYPQPPAFTEQNLRVAQQVLSNRFELVGAEYVLPKGFSWKLNPSRDKEWQIAQHKFSFAVDLAQAYRRTGEPAFLNTRCATC